MAVAKRIYLGTIIYAPVREPVNRNLIGPHNAIVLNPQSEIDSGVDLRVAVITSSFNHPLPSGWFPMPWQYGGHPKTGLTERCVVKATWIDTVPQSTIISIKGRSGTEIYRLIENWLFDKERDMLRRANPPTS